MNEAIPTLLDELGLGCKAREAEWVVPVSPRVPREIVLTEDGSEVRVRTVLVGWDEIGAEEEGALAIFLARAGSELRGVWVQSENKQVVVETRVPTSDLDAGLSTAIGAVLAASRALAQGVATLLVPQVAAAYRQFQSSSHEIVSAQSRI